MHLTQCWHPSRGRCRHVSSAIGIPCTRPGPPLPPTLADTHNALLTRRQPSRKLSRQGPHGGCTSRHAESPDALAGGCHAPCSGERDSALPVTAACAAEARPHLPPSGQLSEGRGRPCHGLASGRRGGGPPPGPEVVPRVLGRSPGEGRRAVSHYLMTRLHTAAPLPLISMIDSRAAGWQPWRPGGWGAQGL